MVQTLSPVGPSSASGRSTLIFTNSSSPALIYAPLKQTQLARHLDPQVLIRQPRRHPPSRRAIEKPDLDQKRLVDLLRRILLLSQRGSQRDNTHPAPGL